MFELWIFNGEYGYWDNVFQGVDVQWVTEFTNGLPELLPKMTIMEIRRPDDTIYSRWSRSTDKWTNPEADARLAALAEHGLSKEIAF